MKSYRGHEKPAVVLLLKITDRQIFISWKNCAKYEHYLKISLNKFQKLDTCGWVLKWERNLKENFHLKNTGFIAF